HRVDHLRHAVPLGFGRKGLDQESYDKRAQHWRENDPRAPRRSRSVKIGIVVEGKPAQEEQVMDPADHAAKDDSPEAGNHTNGEGGQHQRVPGSRLRLGWKDRWHVTWARALPLWALLRRPPSSLPAAARLRT